jgi:group II intron reverse transcriptase/maturase
VQKATAEILNAIYEQDFLDCSYGFRPGRGQHQALDEVGRVICTRPTGWVLEIDVTAYFDSIVREQLMELIEKRVRDGSVLCLIRKWIQVGVIEEGRLLLSETGTGQGQTISPLLANIYLHHVLDEWFENEVKPRLRGAGHEIRFADDAVLCFQYKEDADKVMEVLPKRFAKYGLTIHPEKTRLLEFGRYAEENAKRQGKKAATFDFLGFTYVCARSRKGKFTVARENDEEAVSTGPEGDCRMVPGEPSPACGGAAENPKRQTPGPLPVLRATDELPEYRAVLSGSPSYLA